jgi:hypothetical protein
MHGSSWWRAAKQGMRMHAIGGSLWRPRAHGGAKHTKDQLVQVLLVGGGTRMPSISRFVTNMTGLKPRTGLVDPDAAVATGAAIYSAMLSGQIEGLMMVDVWQAALLRALVDDKLKNDPELREQFLPGEGEEGRVSAGLAQGEEAPTDGVAGWAPDEWGSDEIAVDELLAKGVPSTTLVQ